VQANPNVEICTANSRGEWIRISGTAVFDDSRETMDRVFETMPGLRDIYNDKSGLTLGNLYIKDGIAEFADMEGRFEKLSF
jgi:uncharacterized pyridoxamine 5'-phosphate oxidase family protein